MTAGYRLEWDAPSRPVAVYAGPGPGVLLERSVYDADGRLKGRFAADGSGETYVHSGGQMVEAYDTDGEVLWQALWSPSRTRPWAWGRGAAFRGGHGARFGLRPED